MNDFTKEELYSVNYYLNMIRENCGCVGEHPILSLIEKIQSMIENYCEHSEKLIDVDGGISLVCKKCGITLIDV